jgi:hypothetical protein
LNVSNSETGQVSSGNNHDTIGSLGVTLNSEVTRKKPASEKQIAANQRNSQYSTGPDDSQRTRYNATKHGLCAQGLTPLDDPEEFQEILRHLDTVYPIRNPIGRILKEQLARETIQLCRVPVLRRRPLRHL